MIAGKLDDILDRGQVVHGQCGLTGPNAFTQFADGCAKLDVEFSACDVNAGDSASNFKFNRPISPQYLTDERTVWHLPSLPFGKDAPNSRAFKLLTSTVSGAA